MTSPWERYQSDLQRTGFSIDSTQENAVRHTQRLYEELLSDSKTSIGYWATLRAKLRERKPKRVIRGLYLWGGVGRGKTHIIDNFYHCLPFTNKVRTHFHRFLQNVHQELRTLHNVQNPLAVVAERWAKQAQVLCLDEFHVADITDAMLLTGLLQALFAHGVTLVTTSNVKPDDLYKEGLQRQRFLPAIALIKQYTEVLNVDSGVDYRLRVLEQAEIYHYPLDEEAARGLLESFVRITPDAGEVDKVLEINGRRLQTIRCADGVIWFDFAALCNIPRAVADYIELAKCFNTVFLSDIPCMDETENDRVLRLINLVDEFYDRNVKLIISAQTLPEHLYTGKRQAFQFQRTISRLAEMRSHDYLQRPHLP